MRSTIEEQPFQSSPPPTNEMNSGNNAHTTTEVNHQPSVQPLSQLEGDEFYTQFRQQYNAYWGTLKFEESVNDNSNESKYFLLIDDHVDLTVLRQFMILAWKLKSVSIVIPILSGVSNNKPWKKQKHIDALKQGIKNTTKASEAWFITHGLDVGVPQLIGRAFREEKLLRRADEAWAIQMNRTPKPQKQIPMLIGIVCADEIKDLIDLKIKDQLKIELKVPTKKREQLSLNRDHTHFIIIREQVKNSDEKSVGKLVDSAQCSTNKFRDRFENFLHKGIQQQSANKKNPTDSGGKSQQKTWSDDGFPMVSALFRGTPGTIELLYHKINQDIPCVVVKGTGSAADLIAFAYEEISANNDKEYEDTYLKVEIARRLLEEYPTLRTNNVKRNEIRDYLIQIAKKADQGRRKFLTFIDINSTTSALNDFHKFILSSLLQSQKIVSGNRLTAQFKSNLELTLEWKLPDLALSEIFQRDDDTKYSISYELFDKALLGKKSEQFVDLFLDRDFSLHRYLKSDKLVDLFQSSKDREFLTTTSLEGILGLTGVRFQFTNCIDEEEMPDHFVEQGLNTIVKRLTDISHFFSKHEMDCNAMGIYFGDKSDRGVTKQRMRAEKKALRHLIIFSVLMNRHQLAKLLWKRSSEPIPMALICCMMFKKLAPYCHESYQRLLIEKQAKEFSDCAVGVLDKSFNEDDQRTFEMLDEKHPDWNHMATVELAYNAENKEFMAHAACQKWLTRQFYGEITPRELSWGLFKTPDYLKITCSACLIFPMWFWINFSPIGQAEPPPKKVSDLQGDKSKKPAIGSADQIEEGKKMAAYEAEVAVHGGNNNIFTRLTNILCGKRGAAAKTPSGEPPMSASEEIATLWSAPITKFYTNFLAYLIFLSLFTLAVLWPSCGNLLLDCFVWFWAASIAFENTRVAYEKYCSQSSLPLGQAVLEVLVQTLFLALYLGLRIIGLWNFGTCRVLTAKSVLALGLIYYFYRILFIFLPISPKLGPMMIRLRCMIMDDFITFLQLFVIFMISSGVAITAVLYPHFPLSLELFIKAFVFRGLMALFTSDTQDLKHSHSHCTINATSSAESEYACLRLSHGLSFKYDNLYAYQRYGISSQKCNQSSWIAWFLLIQYFFLAKRFLTSLLTAMFGLTGARVQSQSQQIWMFNRYEIVMEYAKRPRLPPPFVVISYIFMVITSAISKCVQNLKKHADGDRTRTYSSSSNSNARELVKDVANNAQGKRLLPQITDKDDQREVPQDNSCLGRFLNCKPFKQMLESAEAKKTVRLVTWEDSEANLYWKYKAEEFYNKTQETDKTQAKLDGLTSNVTNVQKEIEVQQKTLRQVNDRVVSLEKLMIDSHILIEKMRSTLVQKDKLIEENQKFVHILSRESPYIYTNEARFPVTEKLIPWEIPFDLYDPTVVTLPKEHSCFRDEERPFVESDLLKRSGATSDSDELNSPDIGPATSPGNFCKLEPSTLPVTWPSNIEIPVTDYKWNEIDDVELPNGKKMTVDRTTWVTKPGEKTPGSYQLDRQLLIPLSPMGRTGCRGRGALIRWGPNKTIIALITRWKNLRGQPIIVDGRQMLEAFVFKDKSTGNFILPGGKILGVESPYSSVCRSFNKLAFDDENSEHSLSFTEEDMIEFFASFARNSGASTFESHMVYRGYIDDIRNTDNAWNEAEIWNFHYGSNIQFKNLRTDDHVVWKDVIYHSRGFSMQSSILREIAQIHNAFFQ
ncbi:unnamed protein product [Didymodactylos carnosus]|uniref:1,3-beta-glucan synthase n=2 Tax=Didymodactylos carnosus TaxID=1234261 RepID=A0A813SFB8_9BILA|nr:unnamed protein product [Didymodactylos carnosus]CAF3579001.1 unnamed protein product [Didymodactylos carnosus]